ncbi:MAG TPA: HEAT repeat domain-containing protein, partial [Gemmatimonadales bacterium]|nr:HEAT repeat domain-containing protein [Gemmatimonadales bacterium]
MSIARYILIALSAWPAALPAQAVRASTPWVRPPDLSWIAPMVAAADARAKIALAQAGPIVAEANARARIAMTQAAPVMARAQAEMVRAQARMGPEMARAQADMMRAQAALAGAPWSDGFAWRHGPATTEGYHRTPPLPWAQQDPADRLYRDARRDLNDGRFDRAAESFAAIYTKYPRSTYAGDAYYWQAYALSKRDSDETLRRAREVLRLQKSRAPKARTRRDAEELLTRIEGRLAQLGDPAAAAHITTIAKMAGTPPVPPEPGAPILAGPPQGPEVPRGIATTRQERRRRDRDVCQDEDDTQMAALNALQQMDPERARPILRKVLARRDEGSLCLRRKAVFLISQQEGAETERILLDAARSDPDQEVRSQAVFWLSQVDSPGVVPALDSILRGSSDPVLQEKALFALSQQESPKARQALRDFALRPSISEDLREKAIFWIGQGDDPDRLGFLTSLYGQVKSESAREKVLFSVSQIEGRESQRWLIQIAGDANESIELRKKALFWAGQT